MATFLIGIFLIISILFFFIQKKIAISMLALTTLFFWGIGSGIVATVLLNQLQAPFINLATPDWNNKNAIILLAGGAIKIPGTNRFEPKIGSFSRITKAAQLYFSCVKSHNLCNIIISGGDPRKKGKSEAAVYQNTLTQLGISHSDIILEPNSKNTFKNAELTSEILQRNHFDKITLVTSGPHLKRALLDFSYFHIHAQPALGGYIREELSFKPSAYNFLVTDFAIHEYLGIAQFYIYNLLGWNKKTV